MDTPKLKQMVEELQSSSAQLVEVLERVRDEGRALADRRGTDVNWRWVEQALINIRAYRDALSKAVAERDPVAVFYAAGQFLSIGKYFEDTALEWSSLETNLRSRVSQTANRAGNVARSIRPFDPASVAEAQHSL